MVLTVSDDTVWVGQKPGNIKLMLHCMGVTMLSVPHRVEPLFGFAGCHGKGYISFHCLDIWIHKITATFVCSQRQPVKPFPPHTHILRMVCHKGTSMYMYVGMP